MSVESWQPWRAPDCKVCGKPLHEHEYSQGQWEAGEDWSGHVYEPIADHTADHKAAAAASLLLAALRMRCGGCHRHLPIVDGYFDGDRWHDDGTSRMRCMLSESARAAIAAAEAAGVTS
jgi:hypothetical protein